VKDSIPNHKAVERNMRFVLFTALSLSETVKRRKEG
jgi:hypothetical protein